SAASIEMNPYSIAIVAEDKGPAFPAWSGSNVPPYTDAQVATLILIISWICHRFGIPKNAARTSCIDSAHGVGWHRLGIDGNFPNVWPYWGRQPGCLETSLSTGKPCPGNARITQIVHDIMPRVSSPVPPVPVPEEDTDMPFIVTNPRGQSLLVASDLSRANTMSATAKKAYKSGGIGEAAPIPEDEFDRYERLPRLS